MTALSVVVSGRASGRAGEWGQGRRASASASQGRGEGASGERGQGRRGAGGGTQQQSAHSIQHTRSTAHTHLESLVLQDLLYRNLVIGPWRCALDEFRLEHDAKAAVPNDLAVGVGNLELIPRLPLGCDNSDNLVGILQSACVCVYRACAQTRPRAWSAVAAGASLARPPARSERHDTH